MRVRMRPGPVRPGGVMHGIDKRTHTLSQRWHPRRDSPVAVLPNQEGRIGLTSLGGHGANTVGQRQPLLRVELRRDREDGAEFPLERVAMQLRLGLQCRNDLIVEIPDNHLSHAGLLISDSNTDTALRTLLQRVDAGQVSMVPGAGYLDFRIVWSHKSGTSATTSTSSIQFSKPRSGCAFDTQLAIRPPPDGSRPSFPSRESGEQATWLKSYTDSCSLLA